MSVNLIAGNAQDQDSAISCTLNRFLGNCAATYTAIKGVAVEEDQSRVQNLPDVSAERVRVIAGPDLRTVVIREETTVLADINAEGDIVLHEGAKEF